MPRMFGTCVAEGSGAKAAVAIGIIGFRDWRQLDELTFQLPTVFKDDFGPPLPFFYFPEYLDVLTFERPYVSNQRQVPVEHDDGEWTFSIVLAEVEKS